MIIVGILTMHRTGAQARVLPVLESVPGYVLGDGKCVNRWVK